MKKFHLQNLQALKRKGVCRFASLAGQSALDLVLNILEDMSAGRWPADAALLGTSEFTIQVKNRIMYFARAEDEVEGNEVELFGEDAVRKMVADVKTSSLHTITSAPMKLEQFMDIVQTFSST